MLLTAETTTDVDALSTSSFRISSTLPLNSWGSCSFCVLINSNNNNNNNNPLFILDYTISIASLCHGPVPYTKGKRIYIQDKTNC